MIDKNRKGVVFGMTTPEERKILYNCKTLIMYTPVEGWVEILTPQPMHNSNAYWCPEWDKPIGEELVGKLCMVYDKDEGSIFVVTEHCSSQYYANGHWWDNARIATKKEAMKLITIGDKK